MRRVAFRGNVAAINGPDSNSGMNLFRATIAPVADGRAFFGAVVTTGSHRASLEAVADGRADLAAIDCVSFALMKRQSADLVERVAVVAESPLSPGLPFIMSARLPEVDARIGARSAVRRFGGSRPRRCARRAWPQGRAGDDARRLRADP